MNLNLRGKCESVRSLLVTRSSIASQVLGLTPCESEFFRTLLSVVGDIAIDETPVMTSSISRICRFNLQKCS
jgi:hypothetical protein